MGVGWTNGRSVTLFGHWKLVAWILAAILLYIAADHLINFERFYLTVQTYQIVHGPYALLAAMFVIVCLAASGAGLMLTTHHRFFGGLAFVVCLVLTACVASAWVRGIDISCGCVVGERRIDGIALAKPLLLGLACLFWALQDGRTDEHE